LERAEKSNSEYSTGRYKSQEALEKNRNLASLMKVIWTDFAANSLFEIYKYYKEVASPDVAHGIRFKLFSATRQLIKHPLSGQVEPNLRRLGEDHRYFVVSNN